MKKFIGIIGTVIALFFVVNHIYSQEKYTITESVYPIYYNGVKIEPEQSRLSVNDVTYIPLREFCNVFKININWEEKESKIMLTNNPEENMLQFEIVKDEKTAIEIAKTMIQAIYGRINDKLSFNADFDEVTGLWTVTGSLPLNYDGGAPIVIMQKKDAKIISITYEK